MRLPLTASALNPFTPTSRDGDGRDAMDVEMFHVRSERLLPNTPTFVGGGSVEVLGDVLLSLDGYDTQSFAGYDLIQ